jgi:tRNA (Thr-GGU) A37 N-methylase
LTFVTLLARNQTYYVSGVDMLDKTPLVDIKPYVPRFDSFPMANEGWFKGKQNRPKPEDRE